MRRMKRRSLKVTRPVGGVFRGPQQRLSPLFVCQHIFARARTLVPRARRESAKRKTAGSGSDVAGRRPSSVGRVKRPPAGNDADASERLQ